MASDEITFFHSPWGEIKYAADLEAENKRLRAERKEKGLCLECGDEGEWRTMMLICRYGHGRICG